MATDPNVQLIYDITDQYRSVNKTRYWSELFLLAFLGWGLFFAAVFSPTLSYQQGILFILSVFILYRGTFFIHELVHFQNELPGLVFFYNLFFGWPNKYPFYIYTTHLFHHGKRTYGTKRDPEYKINLKPNPWSLVGPLVSAFILPFFSFVRFGILPLLTPFLGRKFQIWLWQHASTLVMDLTYVRKYRDQSELKMMMFNDLMCSLIMFFALALIYFGILPFATLWLWPLMVMISGSMNFYRAKFNHRYKNDGEEMSEVSHILDCLTIEGGFWTELWAPLRLGYHTLHHVVQDIPYHNLRAAHEDLMRQLPQDHPYRQTCLPSMFSAAVEFLNWATGRNPGVAIK